MDGQAWNPRLRMVATSGLSCGKPKSDYPFLSMTADSIDSFASGRLMKEQQTILLVDDSESDIFLLCKAFTKAEFNPSVQEVHNGEEAIAYLAGDGAYSDRAQFPLPAMMLLDLNMPRKNGFDVLTWLRAQPGLKRLTVVMMTASMRKEDVARAFDLGANSFLVKPSGMEQLVAMVRFIRDWTQFNQFPLLSEVARK